MDAIMSWAKENYDLICLFVGGVGVLVSIISVIQLSQAPLAQELTGANGS